jgi:hypothetical protein
MGIRLSGYQPRDVMFFAVMRAGAAGGLVAVYWFDLGIAGFFAAVAAGCVQREKTKCRARKDLLNR